MLFWHSLLIYERLELYVEVISELTNRESVIWNFIDDTFQDFCKSKANQKIHFSEHKWRHDFHFQEIVNFDDMMWSLFDFTLNKQNDWSIYEKSSILRVLREIMIEHDTLLYLYDDLAYNDRFEVMTSFSNSNSQQKKFNKIMSTMRIAVENSFDIIRNLWIAHAFEKSMKFELQSVIAYYMIAVLLINCYTCLRDNQISKRFMIRSSTLHQYLSQWNIQKIDIEVENESSDEDSSDTSDAEDIWLFHIQKSAFLLY